MDAHLTTRLTAAARDHAVPGAQLTLHRDGRTSSVVTGVTRAGGTDPVTPETAFALGSVTKAFTATVVAQLAADGDIDLDDRIAEHVPELSSPAAPELSSVTIRQVLSHTAALVADHELDNHEDASLIRYAASVANTGLLNAPGTCFSYSNTGYNLLGRAIEYVTDMKWRAALENFLLRPLGIEPLLPQDSADRSRPLATCHTVRPGGGPAQPVGLFLPHSWAPAGGLAAGADDLVRFARLHLGDHPDAEVLLPGELRAELARPAPGADAFGMADGWGLGLARYDSPDGVWLGHDGTVDGGTAHLRFHPASGTALALTTNAGTGTLLWADLVAALRELGLAVGDYRPGLPATAQPLPTDRAAVADRLVGEYRNGDTSFSVRSHPTGLRLSDGTGLVAELALHGQSVFTARRLDAREAAWTGRFVTDPATGEAVVLQLGGRSARRTAA
ncbi:serine hydrolase domain-containing protein [Kitasatospora sp. NPDC089797]|uniref:serine hydrolase domain-containing protein n=1 Tax=Kitasatospora sp. NPDC089797 TaxID=3155298 RepID=UPI00344A3569